MIDLLSGILMVEGLFLLPSLPVLALWWLAPERVEWNLFDYLLLVLPCAVWMIFTKANTSTKRKRVSRPNGDPDTPTRLRFVLVLALSRPGS